MAANTGKDLYFNYVGEPEEINCYWQYWILASAYLMVSPGLHGISD